LQCIEPVWIRFFVDKKDTFVPHLDQLNGIMTFVEVARAGTFTAAAERLGITKSAVGKSVLRLEERLGVKLFHRTTRRLSLTIDGEAYFARCERAMNEIGEAEAALKSQQTSPKGRIRVDMPAAYGRRILLPIFLNMAKRYAGLELTLTFNDRFVDAVEEGIDLLVRIGELADSSGLVARPLTTQRLTVCAAPEYLAQRGTPATINDLANHHCIVGFRRDQVKTWILLQDGIAHRYAPPATHEFGDGDAMLAATLAGCGLSQLPMWLARGHLERGELVEVLAEHSGGEMPIHAIWPRNRHLLPKVRAVVDELVQQAEQGSLD
jgi:DNA-binding transcriptional LysR family regulator